MELIPIRTLNFDCLVFQLRWADVDCALSGSFYELNAKIGMIPESMA